MLKLLRYQGFSLLELFFALTLFLIIATFIFPACSHFLSHNKNQIAMQRIIQLMQNAHFIAASQHADVGIKNDNNTLIVFLDVNHNGVINSDSQILSAYQLSQDEKIVWQTFPSYRNYILFTSTTADNGSIWYCYHERPSWMITVNNQGRIKINPNYKYGKCEV